MSRAIERLRTISKKIGYIQIVCEKSGGVVKALEDEIGARASIMMHFASIAEQFDKLSKEGEFAILSRFDKHDLKGSYDLRNYIVHDYEGLNLIIIESVIREKLPKIQTAIQQILSEQQ